MVDHRNEAFWSVNVPAAHAVDANHRAGLESSPERVEAALVVLGKARLNDGHERIADTTVLGQAAAVAVGPDGPGNAVEDLFANARDLGLDAIVRTCPPAEWMGGGDFDIVSERPGQPAIPGSRDKAGRVEAERCETVGISELVEAPTNPFAPASAIGPSRQAVGGDQGWSPHGLGPGKDRTIAKMRKARDDFDRHAKSAPDRSIEVHGFTCSRYGPQRRRFAMATSSFRDCFDFDITLRDAALDAENRPTRRMIANASLGSTSRTPIIRSGSSVKQ